MAQNCLCIANEKRELKMMDDEKGQKDTFCKSYKMVSNITVFCLCKTINILASAKKYQFYRRQDC